MNNLILIKYIPLLLLLLIISVIDLKTKIIPPGLVVLGIILGFFINIYFFNRINILGFIFGGLFPLLLAFITDGGIGGGDIKILAMLGLWVGFKDITYIMLILFIITSIIIGIALILRNLNLIKDRSMAFAPYITFSTLIYYTCFKF